VILLLKVKTPVPVVVISNVLNCLLAIPPIAPEMVKLSLAVMVKASVLSLVPLMVPEIIC
jgi:hypothetical protein